MTSHFKDWTDDELVDVDVNGESSSLVGWILPLVAKARRFQIEGRLSEWWGA